MNTLKNEVQVGIRDKETNEIIKIYPFKVKGDFDKISNTVMTWYYTQNCINEDNMRDYYVDVID